VTITLADVLPVAIVVAVQSIHYKAVRPYPAHLFIDVLAKVGYVKNATSIVQVRIHQVFPKALKQGKSDLPLVRVHNSSTANSVSDDSCYFLECTLICAILTTTGGGYL
jgi:hypothetical protein